MFQLQKAFKSSSCSPYSVDAEDLVEDCLSVLETVQSDPEAKELTKLLCKPHLESLLKAHDKIGQRQLAMDSMNSTSTEEPDDGAALMARLSNYSEPNIKVVRIEKTNEPLGATVKNEDDAIVIGRIIRGGTAEECGLLHEGDELLEVNEVPLRGKNVNEVYDIFGQMKGTLTLLVVPTRQFLADRPTNRTIPPVMHVKAHIDYDPEDDLYIPCKELGLSFVKGDILHVLNQSDPHWWQARRQGEDDSQLPGLIPSASFQQQREAVKQTIANDVTGNGPGAGHHGHHHRTSSGFLCAKRSGRRKKNKHKVPYVHEDVDLEDEFGNGEESIAYEEVALYYPRSDRKRPVVLIGPPNIGRHELRQRLMQDGDRFAAAIPRKFSLQQ